MAVMIQLTDGQCARLRAGLPEGSEFHALVVKAEEEGKYLLGDLADKVCFPLCDRLIAERFMEAAMPIDRLAAIEIRNAILEPEGR